MTRLEKDLAGLATMSPAQLRERWEQLSGAPVPAVADSLLLRAVAHALQENALGGLSASACRTLQALAELGPTGLPELAIRLKPGTRLMRRWNGRMHSVLVTEDGFQFDGKPWRSLSAIAERITGAHWSGPRFFGLRRRSLPLVQVAHRG